MTEGKSITVEEYGEIMARKVFDEQKKMINENLRDQWVLSGTPTL